MEPIPDRLDSALTHVTALYGQYITQRQNLVSYFLVGVGLLSVGYSGSVGKEQWPVSIAVCVVGTMASVGACFQDERLKDVMEITENALQDLQNLLSMQVFFGTDLGSLRIQERIKGRAPAGGFRRRGPIIRTIYLTIGIMFVLGVVFAVITRPV